MRTHRIYHCCRIKAHLDSVRSALTEKKGLAGWWTKNIDGSETPGSILTFRFSSGAFNRMKIVSVETNRIEWECVDGHEEWIGTRIAFEIRRDGEQVKVCFSHSGWRELTEYVGECSFHWAQYLVSLQRYCESGQGMPNEG
jgi:uncharacterized protein YndB with AHSA1/START domain